MEKELPNRTDDAGLTPADASTAANGAFVPEYATPKGRENRLANCLGAALGIPLCVLGMVPGLAFLWGGVGAFSCAVTESRRDLPVNLFVGITSSTIGLLILFFASRWTIQALRTLRHAGGAKKVGPGKGPEAE